MNLCKTVHILFYFTDFNVAETTTEMNKELTTASIMSMLTNTSSTTGTTKLNTIKTPKVGLVLKSSTFESYITVWC